VAEKYCDGLGACLGECPTGALKIVEREAEDFDEEAVEEYLKAKSPQTAAPAGDEPEKMACGCPSSMIRDLGPSAGQGPSISPAAAPAPSQSQLSHWPVQINLIPPHAPFLKGADLLITADCVPVALPDYHSRYVPGKVVMLGCPKFDDQTAYIEKFTQIFEKAQPSSLTVLIMEVPCCSQMLYLLNKALESAGMEIPVQVKVVGLKGEIKGTMTGLR